MRHIDGMSQDSEQRRTCHSDTTVEHQTFLDKSVEVDIFRDMSYFQDKENLQGSSGNNQLRPWGCTSQEDNPQVRMSQVDIESMLDIHNLRYCLLDSDVLRLQCKPIKEIRNQESVSSENTHMSTTAESASHTIDWSWRLCTIGTIMTSSTKSFRFLQS